MGKLGDAKKGAAGSAKKQNTGAANQKCPNIICVKKVPAAPDNLIGTCDYYIWREKNFRERHVGCGHTPPDYYLNYGHKYCMKFGTELHPKLSAKGQEWLANARRLLQVYMEEGIQRSMAIELDSAKFRKFAFDTHPDAYWNGGLADVPMGDKMKILATPDLSEWGAWSTWKQAGIVGGKQIGHWGSSGAKTLGESKIREAEANQAMSQAIVDYFRKLFK